MNRLFDALAFIGYVLNVVRAVLFAWALSQFIRAYDQVINYIETKRSESCE